MQNTGHANVKEALKSITNILREKTTLEAYAYLKAHLNQWAQEKVTIAVTGETGSGKSAFINVIRGVKVGDPGSAKQGRGNTTKKPTFYEHPGNNNISFCDLPGAGTLKFPKDKYFETMNIDQYDIVLIFLNMTLSEDALWFAKTLHTMNKPFCFVRSKIDDDILRAQKDGSCPNEILRNIKENIEIDIQSDENLKRCLNLFLISNDDTTLGNWEQMISFINDNLSEGKKEAILYALPNLTTDIIDKKYSQLRSRLLLVTGGCSVISAVPIPLIDVVINIGIVVSEIKHYINVFGLRLDELEKLEGFDTNQLQYKTILDPKIDIAKLVTAALPKFKTSLAVMTAESVTDVLAPVLGSSISVVTTAKIVYDYLDRVVKGLKEDASLVYGHIAEIEKNSFRL